MNERLWRYLPPFLLIGALGFSYCSSLAPGLTWANRGADGGDLITAAATNGVAHPSGYPTYLVLARLFQMIPVGTLAYRTNLLSAVSAILAALLVYDLAAKSYQGSDYSAKIGGWVAGLGFGLSPLLWSQAVITEVYTLHVLFVAAVLWLTPLIGSHAPQWRDWFDRLSGLVFGLALGNQITVAFLLPPWLALSSLKRGFDRQGLKKIWENGTLRSFVNVCDWEQLLRRSAWLLIGLLIYTILPLRARSGLPVNWGNPVNFENFWWLISGELYQDRVFNLQMGILWPRIRDWLGLLQTQFGLIGFVISVYGLFFGKPASRRFYWIIGWMALAYSVFAIGYSSPDSYTLLIPAFLAFSLWFGLGAADLFEKVYRSYKRRWIAPVAFLLLTFVILGNAWTSFPEIDASKDNFAEVFGSSVMTAAPQNAILFTQRDEDSFTLWYFHYALNARPDLVVIVEPLLDFDWYRETIRSVYPDFYLPNLVDYNRAEMIGTLNRRPTCQIDLDSAVMPCPSCDTLDEVDKVLNCTP